MSMIEEFNAKVAEWLLNQGHPVGRVVRVEASGTDWDGDTEQGFRANAYLEVYWTGAPGGRETRTEVGGDDFEDLWRFVMSGPRA